MSEESSTELVPADESAPSDEAREALLGELTDLLGESLIESHLIAGRDLWIRVSPDGWVETATALRDAGLDYFDFLAGLDWQIAEWGRYENTELDEPADEEAESTSSVSEGPGYAGGDSRFQVMLRLYDIERHLGVTVKVDLDEEYPELPTISGVFGGADWHERETWEMYGFTFVGHPHLVHLYLPADFEGHPLRKDFPLISRIVKPWPGVVDVEPIPEHLEAELEAAALAAAEEAS